MIPAQDGSCRLSDRIDRLVRRVDRMPAKLSQVEAKWIRGEADSLLTNWTRSLLEEERQWLVGVVVWMDENLDGGIPV
jgi:hypothetical protein